MPPQTAQWASVAKPGPYTTSLNPAEEQQFQGWVKQNKVPWQDSSTADYDMRGFWKGLQGGDPTARTAINSVDHQIHYPDKWKTPYHQTFSNESQYATPNAGHWQGETFVPPGNSTATGARPSPSQWLAQQSPSDFLASDEGKNATAAPAPPPAIAPPPAMPGALARTAYGVGRGLNNLVEGTYQTFVHPINTAEGIVNSTEQHLRQAQNEPSTIGKMAEYGAAVPVLGPLGQSLGQRAATGDYAGAVAEGLTTAVAPEALRLLAPPTVKAITGGGRAINEGAAGVVRRSARAGPVDLESAAGKVAADTAENAAANTAKLREARANAVSAEAERLAKQNASDYNWEEGTKAKTRKYLNDVAENEQAHADLTKEIQSGNEKGHADVVRRQALDTELQGQHSSNINGTRQAAAEDLTDAKSQYPDLTDGGKKEMPAADEAQTLAQVNEAVARTLKGSGNIPRSIRDVIADYTPGESEGGGWTDADGTPHGPGDPVYEDLKAKGLLRPEEEVTPGQAPEKATADMLHGQMTEVMKEYMGATGDEKAALGAVGDVLRTQLRNLYKAEGRLPEFDAAQTNYAKVMRRYYDRSSPLSRLLNDRNAQAAFDPKAAGTGSVARPEVAERMLKGQGNAAVIERYLRDRHPELADSFRETAAKMAERDSLPKKFNPKQIPIKKEIPVPDIPLREELPSPTESAIPGGGLKPPPEAFDKQAFIKQRIREAGARLGSSSGWEYRLGGGALLGTALGRPLTGALVGLGELGLEKAAGRMMEKPGFQEWAARTGVKEPPAPPVGAGAQPGPTTPFAPPPQSGAPGAGATPFTPPPGASPASAADAGLQASTRSMALRDLLSRTPASMTIERARIIKELEQSQNDARRADNGPPTGQVERRTLKPTATMAVPPEVASKIKAAGLVSKGEVMPGSGVFQVEHPDFPGKTFSISATDTPAEIARKVAAMRERFGK